MKLALLLLVCVGCLEVPKPPHGMCKVNADCAAGEVCLENVCWGDPPPGPFAATLAPPSDRTDLVSVEVPQLAIPDNGWLGELTMRPPVTIGGRVEAYCAAGATDCTTSSIGASISITRRSLFAGGPGFKGAFSSKDGIARGTDSWTSRVPQAMASDPPYVLTFVPDGRDLSPPASGTSPAMIAPPGRVELAATDNVDQTFTLGSASSKLVTGSLDDGQLSPHPLARYRVVALGRWDSAAPLAEVSTVAYVGDVLPTTGSFSLKIADGVIGDVEIVAAPYDPMVVAPTLRLPGVMPGDNANHTLSQPTNTGNRVDLAIPIEGLAADGSVQPVSGAHVVVAGHYDPTGLTATHAVLVADATTGDDGLAHVSLLDGDALASSYTLSVVPPASSPLGAIYAAPFAVNNAMPVRLPPRVGLRGVVTDVAGNPLANVSVTVRPSLRFAWNLDAASQQFLAEIPAATAVTPDDGSFVLWVDPFITTDLFGYYDLELEPPMGSPAPIWTRSEVAIPPTSQMISSPMTIALPPIAIPDAANVHGYLVDASGAPVMGGELRIFQIVSDLSLCQQVKDPPASCVLPAVLLGHGTSDGAGIARLTLPRPQ